MLRKDNPEFMVNYQEHFEDVVVKQIELNIQNIRDLTQNQTLGSNYNKNELEFKSLRAEHSFLQKENSLLNKKLETVQNDTLNKIHKTALDVKRA